MRNQRAIRQMETTLSSPPDTRYLPSAENTTERTGAECPPSFSSCLPVVVSHSRTELSLEALASSHPEGWKASDSIGLSCPHRTFFVVPVFNSKIRMPWS